MTRAILLSGGQDSLALAYWLKPDLAVTINYGQAAAPAEIRAGEAFCNQMRLRHEVVQVDCRGLGRGEMVGGPKCHLAPTEEWWPFRNQLLVTLAAMKLVPQGVQELLIGTVKGDSIHGDGRESFVQVMSALLNLQEGGLVLRAPALHLTTPELVSESKIPLNLLALAFSCHRGEIACGLCRGCIKNREVFEMMEDRRASEASSG